MFPNRRCVPFSVSPIVKRNRPRPNYLPLLVAQLTALKLPLPTAEYHFHPDRRWRFDAAWTFEKVALEIEGGVFVGGRHTRGVSFERDCEKYAEAMVRGWRVLRVTPRFVKDGRAVAWLERLLR